MQIPVLVEPLKGNGYRTGGTEPFALSAKGPPAKRRYQNCERKSRTA
jgi:hypothetical protein